MPLVGFEPTFLSSERLQTHALDRPASLAISVCKVHPCAQTLRLCTGRAAHREGRGIALLFHDQRQ
jgi:hypothetical protein